MSNGTSFHGSETLPALCWCEAEIVPATHQQILDGDVYCDQCKPSVCALCAGEHTPTQCSLSVGYRRRPRRDRGIAKPSRRRRVEVSAFALPLLGEWPAWMTVLTAVLVVLYVLQRFIHLTDPGPGDAPDVAQPGDMSTLAGWDEYVIGNRLERELDDPADRQDRP